MKSFIPARRLSARILGFVLATALLLPGAARPAERQTLPGHVPDPVATQKLAPQGQPAASDRIPLTIGLPLRDRQGLDRLVERLYDPASPSFHRYLKPGEFTARFGPTEQDYQKVIAFAKANGLEITRTSDDRVLLEVEAPVSAIEKTFRVTLRNFWDPKEARIFFAPDAEPTVEAEVPILFISGLNNFFVSHPMSHHRQAPPGETSWGGSAPNGSSFMGKDFRNAYAAGASQTGSGQSVGLYEKEGYFASDITDYENLAGISTSLPIQNVVLPGFSMNNSDANGIEECSLDIEMVISMAPGLSKLYVFEGTGSDQILQSMAAYTQVSQFSSSWGMDRDPVAEGYFEQLASQGQSFFMASGDGDAYVGSIWGGGDDVYVTSVGGATLTMTNHSLSYASEQVWNWHNNGPPAWCCNGQTTNDPYWGSGGGVSTLYSIPLWQRPINMTAVGGSSSMRNVPDVAMTSDQIWINANHTTASDIGGTSAAAPLWAGFAALVNEQAVAQGQPAVGFLNPAIYAIGRSPNYASCFHDITTGDNTWPGSPNLFHAATGYDLCTGWGSPNGANLIYALLEFAGPVFVDFNYTGPANGGSTQPAGSYNYPFKTLTSGVGGVKSAGTIFIKTAGSSSESLTISKPMTISAMDGPATVGN